MPGFEVAAVDMVERPVETQPLARVGNSKFGMEKSLMAVLSRPFRYRRFELVAETVASCGLNLSTS